MSVQRSIGALSAFDLLVALMLGEVVDEIIYGDVTLLKGFVVIAVVALWHFANEWSSYKSKTIARLTESLRFMEALGENPVAVLSRAEFYISHEGLNLFYEAAQTRVGPGGGAYDLTTHLPWIGERTRQLDGAHLEFFAGIRNPVGCKLGPTTTVDEALAICERLNPEKIPGHLTLISRMGAAKVEDALPPLLAAVRDAGHPVVWACDPMHGNTFTSQSGHKTRRFDDILAEIKGFFTAHKAEGTWPGGVHVELTGDDVTECLGGAEEILDVDLGSRYETMCDPRLNGRQSVDLAFAVAELLRG